VNAVALAASTAELKKEIIQLLDFAKWNQEGFRKILKKYVVPEFSGITQFFL
jgi:hypothetical protein